MKKWIFLSSLASLAFVTPVFANKNSTDTSIFAEALIWQIHESNATNWGQILDPANANETIKFLNVPFKWSPGVRIGVSFNGKDKPWNILFYYTGYKTRGTDQAATDTEQIHSAFSSNFYANNPQGNGISGPYYHRAAIQWDVAFNTLDLELARQINLNKLVNLRPFMGIKGGIINQSIDSTWGNPPPVQGALTPTFTNATENITNDFKGIGPSLGLDTTFHLYTTPTHGFNLIGNFSGAILWSTWKLVDNYQNNTPQSIATVNDSLTAAATMVRGYLGVEWSSLTRNVNWNLRVGYEAQVWFSQLQYYSFDMGKTNDTLYLNGAVLGFDVEF